MVPIGIYIKKNVGDLRSLCSVCYSQGRAEKRSEVYEREQRECRWQHRRGIPSLVRTTVMSMAEQAGDVLRTVGNGYAHSHWTTTDNSAEFALFFTSHSRPSTYGSGV